MTGTVVKMPFATAYDFAVKNRYHYPGVFGIGAYCRWAENYAARVSRIVTDALERGMSRPVIARVLREEGVGG